jgi:hypothetical protein
MGNRTKVEKAFGEGPFGVPDVPLKVGHKLQSWLEHTAGYPTGRADKRSWKRRRKTRWRPKGG